MKLDSIIKFDKGFVTFNPMFMIDVIMLLEGFKNLEKDEAEFLVDYISEQVGKVSDINGEELTLQVESGPIGERILDLLSRAVEGPIEELQNLINETRSSMQKSYDEAKEYEKTQQLA